MLTIGEFAAVTHLSVRTLRRYHEIGLLEPAAVDPATNYRRYTAEQIPAAQVIHRLRELDVPLAEVRAVLAADGPGARADLVGAHLRRLEDDLDRRKATVAAVRRLLRPVPADPRVELRAVPARTVAAVSENVTLGKAVAWFDGALDELDAAFPSEERTGPPGGVYANDLFARGAGPMTVYRPVREPRPYGRIDVTHLPPADLAVTTHSGPHDDLDVTYGLLGAWVVNHALAIDGPVHETYLIGPRDTPARDDWRTEIGWPVFRLAA